MLDHRCMSKRRSLHLWPGKRSAHAQDCKHKHTAQHTTTLYRNVHKTRVFSTPPFSGVLGRPTIYNNSKSRTRLRVLSLHSQRRLKSSVLQSFGGSNASGPFGPYNKCQAPQRHQEWEPLHCQALELDDEGADEGCDRCGLEPQLDFATGAALGFPLPAPLSFSSSSWSS